MGEIQNVKVSVCMITYNHAKYIRKAIQGVLKQKVDFPLELIIADDCSTDDTVNIIESEISNNTSFVRIKLNRNHSNLGVNRNFTEALYACHGEYIAICEGDDYWVDENKLQIQFGFLESHSNFVMSFHNSKIEKNDLILEETILNKSTKRDLIYEDLVYGFYTIPTLTVFFRNIIKNRLPFQFLEITNCDSFLFLFLSQYGKIHYHENIFDVVHVYHRAGIWSMKTALDRSIRSYNTYLKAYSFFKDKRLFIPIVNFGNAVIINAIKSRKYVLALKFYVFNLVTSFRYFPASKFFVSKQIGVLKRW
jgi:glycosyltransferase involved in cell wall biosynthesis